MIGMINLPSDSPIEFYSAPHSSAPSRFEYIDRPSALPRVAIEDDDDTKASQSDCATPSTCQAAASAAASLGLFVHRKRSSLGYCPDGRRCKDGRVLEQTPPTQLWDELLVRHLVARIGDEIQSPVAATPGGAAKRSLAFDRQISQSNPALVSSSRVARFRESTRRFAHRLCTHCKRVVKAVEHRQSRDDLSIVDRDRSSTSGSLSVSAKLAAAAASLSAPNSTLALFQP